MGYLHLTTLVLNELAVLLQFLHQAADLIELETLSLFKFIDHELSVLQFLKDILRQGLELLRGGVMNFFFNGLQVEVWSICQVTAGTAIEQRLSCFRVIFVVVLSNHGHLVFFI